MEHATPKQYMDIGGKTLLRHTIDRFTDIIPEQNIRVIIDANHRTLYQNSVTGLNLLNPCIGSNSRKNSIYNGLKSFSNLKDDDIILVHDAARPFIDAQDILKLLDNMSNFKAATLCHPVTDTLISIASNTYPDRNQFRAIQTPQAFWYKNLLDAHEHFSGQDHFTDDSALALAFGIDVAYVDGCKSNYKITTQDDLAMAEHLLKGKTMTRTGIGFDVHAFDEMPAKSIRIGGIDIPFSRKLKGHSDADVALHTITDALLGAVAAGDIGDHFPPSDQTYKNMDSAIFLQKAAEIVRNRGGDIINIDLVIMCEEPKIGPYKESIQKRIADILNLPQNAIGVKATTTEKLGFTGRKEGIAAQAVANIEVQR
jgi:2-C-methyl-D-erythritol 4-phosphate cytidylyltransferase / 2-C-methyl-D-erythritol 2,4-cyclodiphosphate synthase